MQIEDRFENPLTFDFNKMECVTDNPDKENIPLVPGAINGLDNYGFVIISTHDGDVVEESFTTQERITAFGIENDLFHVYEEGKYSPWLFDTEGRLIRKAHFYMFSKRDVDYVYKKYGITLEDLPTNNEIKKSKN